MKKNKYHLMGIAGIGMSGLAILLREKGYCVSGCDLRMSGITQTLEKKFHIPVYSQHQKARSANYSHLIFSSAIPKDHPELEYAKRHNAEVVGRAACLASLLSAREQIVITGTHGKTTTTSWIAWMLQQHDPQTGYYIGGISRNLSHHAALGDSPLFVLEADESDNTLHYYLPKVLLLTNLEPDHLENYHNDFACLVKSMEQRITSLDAEALLIINGDDAILKACAEKARCRVVTFGLRKENDYSLHNIRYTSCMSADVKGPRQFSTSITTELFGRHNLYNALASITTAAELGIPKNLISQACASFKGVERRQDVWSDKRLFNKSVTLVGDYGHHPTAIASLHESLRAKYPNQRLVWVYQPHRYSRTQHLFKDFVNSLSLADQVILMDVYAASEEMIEGANSEALAHAISEITHKPTAVCSHQNIEDQLEETLHQNDVVVFQGAGDINTCFSKYIDV